MKDTNIQFNIKAHNRIAKKYESHHPQIFNEIEQQRILGHLKLAQSFIRSDSRIKKAFDFGCGSGNITRHLLDIKFDVTAADVAKAFLQMVKEKYSNAGNLQTLKINGSDLSTIKNNSFDLTVSYSVLHHVPQYLGMVKELIRITKPGGVIMIDNEAPIDYWEPTEQLQQFRDLVFFAPPKPSIFRYLKWDTYVHRWKRFKNPRFQPEGDIHIWQDDHIEWDKIKNLFTLNNCEVLLDKKYLSYDSSYPIEIYDRYKDLCSDDKIMIVRKYELV